MDAMILVRPCASRSGVRAGGGVRMGSGRQVVGRGRAAGAGA
ncbi:hypothetical protein [Streptomyces sp. NBC_01637]|nr:hypothetical protein OH719_32470 [Streptomyces sp. NBC_01653]WTD33227.1 hypothetical protein OHB03_13855 [Streptomyces sp. NBC_01643]WTD88710.1 hypothetical protein OG891_14400 [Streptomyces sp. NBC_01637]